MTNDGSPSWIVISPGLNKYVDELYKEQGESFSASGSGMVKSVATKHKGQSSPQSHPVSKMFVPIEQRKWNCSHLEKDGAIDWNTLSPVFCRDYEYENAWRWTSQEWLDLLHTGSDKKRFQYCLNSDSLILHMFAIQGHSGEAKVDRSLLDK